MKKILVCIIASLLIVIGLLLVSVGRWVPNTFGDIPFAQVIFHLLVPLEGADSTFAIDFIKNYVVKILIVLIVIVFVIVLFWKLFNKRNNKVLKIISILYLVFSICTLSVGVVYCSKEIHFDEYLHSVMNPSSLYEDYYIDAKDVHYTFPEQKRNLIYIFLESMETTYADKEHGGAFDESRIPELTELSENNLTFTNGNYENDGFLVPVLSSWTVAAMVAHSSGIPLNVPSGPNSYDNEEFLPGIYSLGDILADNGYKNELFIGSDAKFGGRKYYYKQHGNYEILDYYDAIHKKLIPENYWVWWGYEDEKLFEYAKDELIRLSQTGQPFNFNMLTTDTHFVGGYSCPKCVNYYGDQYSNVIRCSSKQVTSFIEWIQQQSFYENTTIVVAGDHKSMDADWFKENVADNYIRKAYYTIINSPVVPETNESRQISSYDLFPTTLASLGVTFDSDRLGLGTNLFKSTKTLVEQMGFEKLDEEINRYSRYYNKNILYGDK